MAFKITDRHVDQYHRDGYVVFEQLIPSSLLGELRVVAEKARQIAHERHGRQAQRLQPVQAYDLDLKPYRALTDLPELNDAIFRLFGSGFRYAWMDEARTVTQHAILFEPSDTAWCTHWHRDWRDNIPGLAVKAWEERMSDMRLFNQVNAPLYDDGCTWIVPGSHLRRDTNAEIARFPDRPIPGAPIPRDADAETVESVCLEYTRSMPGAVQARLHAGDFMLYRNSLWHIGNYVPYLRRATIHDGVWTPAFEEWFKNWPRREDGEKGYVNANIDTEAYRLAKAGA